MTLRPCGACGQHVQLPSLVPQWGQAQALSKTWVPQWAQFVIGMIVSSGRLDVSRWTTGL